MLALLGFAATDFIITMTLSAADASAHLIENPNLDTVLGGHQLLITIVLLAALGGVFLRGFGEAIGLAVFLVATYLVLNLVVVAAGAWEILRHPSYVDDWSSALVEQHGSPLVMVGDRAAGLPQARARHVRLRDRGRGDAARRGRRHLARGRIRGTKRLLTTAALTMSFFLIASSFVTTLLIPADEFEDGGAANGRALAYVAHGLLGNAFGSVTTPRRSRSCGSPARRRWPAC